MKKFGSAINYIIVDLINLYKNNTKENFINNRNNYLLKENIPNDSLYYQLNYEKMTKMINFIDNYLDSITCENEMKMECYFNQDEPAFINDKVNKKLFNFTYADKIYNFAKENKLDIRIHTIIWYKHVPQQLINYVKDKPNKKELTLDFIKTYMMCLNDRYPDCYCVDVINEIAADPDELYFFKENNIPLYEFDENGIRIDDWYKLLGKDYYIEIFKLARQVFGENTKLFYNDCNEGNKEKQKTYSFIINNIKEYENKYNIHLLNGFGMQSHFWGSEDENIEYMDNLYSFYTNLDLEIQITEFDVSNHSNKNIQNSIFKNFINIIPKYNITNFTTWGLNDLVSWYSEYDATLIDKDCNFKSFTQKYIDTFSNKNSKRKEDNK